MLCRTAILFCSGLTYKMYDVIVIGADPAGCTAAKLLAQRGYKTLLVEKFKIPRYKSCSGQLIKKSIDLVLEIFGENVPEKTMCSPIENRGMIFTNDKGREFRFEQSGLNVWRSSFDGWLAEKAAENDAEIRDNTMALDCEEDKSSITVILRGNGTYREKAKYLICCEGAAGNIKKKCSGQNKPPFITTFQTYNQGSIDLDYHYFYAYLQPELSEYDAWFNVKDEQLVLGVSVKENRAIRQYYDKFISYMEKNHRLKIERQLKTDKWIMPYIQPGCGINCGGGRILFAGEAAGFLNPMGEGISAALESGYHIADAVSENFENTDAVLSSYKDSLEPLHQHMKRQWRLVAGLADTFKEMAL